MPISVGQTSKGRSAGASSQATNAVNTNASGSAFLILIAWSGAATFISLVDSKGNTLTLIDSEVPVAGVDHCRAYYVENGVGGTSHQWTLTISASNVLGLMALEVPGGSLAGILDQHAGRDDTSSPYTLASGLTTLQAAELLVAALFGNSGSNPGTMAEGGLGSSTIQTNTQETDGTQFFCGAMATKIVSSTGTFNPSWTQSGSTGAATWLFSFKEAAGAASFPPVPESPLLKGQMATLLAR